MQMADLDVPALTTEQMVEVDRAMIENYHIDLVQMMENAGRNLAHLARIRFLGSDPRGKRIVVLVGSGGNGGGALVCARRLSIWGATVLVRTTRVREMMSPVPRHQLDILERMGIPVKVGDVGSNAGNADLVVDGVIGYSLKGAPRGVAAQLIRWANAQSAPVLALDLPSGLDATTGEAREPALRAAATLTLALPKAGLLAEGALPYVGELYLADVSVPPALYEKLGIQVGALFAQEDIIRLF